MPFESGSCDNGISTGLEGLYGPCLNLPSVDMKVVSYI